MPIQHSECERGRAVAPRARGILGWAIALTLAACSAPAEPTTDGGLDSGGMCVANDDCDDGAFCTGIDTCAPSDPSADARGCVRRPACVAGETCDEAANRCIRAGCERPDMDGDGLAGITCAGTDCDDADSSRYPGAAEVCDSADRDEDCDPSTFGVRDGDGDGEPDSACCNSDPASGVDHCGTDCDDTRASVHVGASEQCNGRDDDCDGAIDEDETTRYLDCDGDLFGNSTVTRPGCPVPVTPSADCPAPSASSSWVTTPGDCDDQRPSTHPGATDTCNGRDDDCTLPIDPATCTCTDGDTTQCGYDAMCRPVSATCVGGAFACPPGLRTGGEAETCDAVDNNCNGIVDEACPCMPVGQVRSCTGVGVCGAGTETCTPTGWAGCAVPSAETCDMRDQNCDGRTDEGLHLGVRTASWATMQSHDAQCSSAGDCNFAFHLACAGTAPDSGDCAYTTGWGIRDENATTVDFYCIDVPLRQARWAEFGTGCRYDTRYDDVCYGRVDSWCQANGYLGGFGPLTRDGTLDYTYVACVTPSQGTRFASTYTALATAQPLCSSTSARFLCENAVQAWCRIRGYYGGFGPLQWSGDNTEWICVSDF